MGITQDRMIRLIQCVDESQEQFKILKQLASAYRKDPRIAEAVQLAHSVGGQDASHPIFRAVDLLRQPLNELADLVEKEQLSVESLIVLDRERRHFLKRQESNRRQKEKRRLKGEVSRSYFTENLRLTAGLHEQNLKLRNPNSNF